MQQPLDLGITSSTNTLKEASNPMASNALHKIKLF